jgi:type VI secretion system protein ImpG
MNQPIAEDLYKAFLDEMKSLENFRVTYTSVHASASVEREDPEVRRLIDAMAFFSARTRTAALRNLLSTQRRLFQQYFSFLLSPMPAMGMLQAQTTGRFAETTVLPRGSEVLIAAEGRPGAVFHTAADMRILPIQLAGIQTLLRSSSGTRVVLTFKSAFPRNDEIGLLPLFVNHLDDYAASLSVLYHLRKHLERAIVVYGEEPIDDLTKGTTCDVSYGAVQEPDELPELTHPLQAVRSFLHYPQQELFFNVKISEKQPNWKQFSICLDFKATWPKSLRLNKDMFQLFTVPISNLKRSMGSPLLAAGTQDRFPLRYPSPAQKFALHSVVGVFQIEEKGLLPLKPGMVTGGSGSYEIEHSKDEDGATAYVKLQFPEAFTKPRKISVDAFWLQPWFSDEVAGKLRVQLSSRSISGATFELRGDIRPHQDNLLQDDFEGMLQILALKSKAVGFNLDDIGILLNALGSMKASHFKQLHSYLAEVSVQILPQLKDTGSGQRQMYKFRLKESDAAFLPLIEAGLRQLANLLKIWTPDSTVSVEAQITGSDEILRF